MNRTDVKRAWKSLESRANRQYKKGYLKSRFNWDGADFIKWYLGEDDDENKLHRCYYCHIPGDKFTDIWGKFYGGKRGKRLEVDRQNNQDGYHRNNCVKACSLCNCAKSDKIEFEDFIKVGELIEKIWKKTAERKGISWE